MTCYLAFYSKQKVLFLQCGLSCLKIDEQQFTLKFHNKTLIAAKLLNNPHTVESPLYLTLS